MSRLILIAALFRGGRAVRDQGRLPRLGLDEGEQTPDVGGTWGGRVGGLRGRGRPPADPRVREGLRRIWGVFIALSLAWGVLVDGFCSYRYDLLGVLICVVGVLVMVGPSRG